VHLTEPKESFTSKLALHSTHQSQQVSPVATFQLNEASGDLRKAMRESNRPVSDERLIKNPFILLFVTFDKKLTAMKQKSSQK
jgi:hypothetical protein